MGTQKYTEKDLVLRAHGSNFKDLTGRVYGMLTVERFAGYLGKYSIWWCKCECGKMVMKRAANILHHSAYGRKTTKPQNCGCKTYPRMNSPHKIDRNLESSWRRLASKGRLCQAWADDFMVFAIAVGKRPSSKHHMVPIDKDFPMGPGNWRWSTSTYYSATNIDVRGAAKRLGLSPQAVYQRLKRHPPETALNTPQGQLT